MMQYKHSSKWMILIVMCGLNNAYAHEDAVCTGYQARTISSERVAAMKAELEQELFYNAIQRYAVATACTAAIIGAGYMMLNGKSSAPKVSESEHVGSDGADVSNADILHEIKIAKDVQRGQDIKLNAIMRITGASTDSASSWYGRIWGWMKSSSSTLGSQVAIMAVFSVVNNGLGPISRMMHFFDDAGVRFAHKIFHEGNLNWFMSTHVQIPLVMKSLLQHSAAFEGKAASEIENIVATDREYHEHAVYAHWNILVGQLESLLAFMEYQASKSIDKQFVAALVDRIKTQAIKMVDSCSVQFGTYHADRVLFERLSEFDDRLNELLREYRINEVLLG